MRAVVQRVSSARVSVEEAAVGEIGPGLLVLLGVGTDDTPTEADRLAGRIARLRIFGNDEGKFDLSVLDTGGEILVVSQFTLLADTDVRRELDRFHERRATRGSTTARRAVLRRTRRPRRPGATGVFGARMQVELVNDGPVTIVLDVGTYP